MIKLDNQYETICHCGQKAICREVGIQTNYEFRKVSYSSHANCLLDERHNKRLREVHTFFDKLDELVKECNDNLPKLEKGLVIKIDLGYELPNACSKYEQVKILAEIKAFSQSTEIILDPVPLFSLTRDKVTNLVVEAAKPYIDGFEANFKAGKF